MRQNRHDPARGSRYSSASTLLRSPCAHAREIDTESERPRVQLLETGAIVEHVTCMLEGNDVHRVGIEEIEGAVKRRARRCGPGGAMLS